MLHCWEVGLEFVEAALDGVSQKIDTLDPDSVEHPDLVGHLDPAVAETVELQLQILVQDVDEIDTFAVRDPSCWTVHQHHYSLRMGLVRHLRHHPLLADHHPRDLTDWEHWDYLAQAMHPSQQRPSDEHCYTYYSEVAVVRVKVEHMICSLVETYWYPAVERRTPPALERRALLDIVYYLQHFLAYYMPLNN